jgi:chemotaxis protein MotB
MKATTCLFRSMIVAALATATLAGCDSAKKDELAMLREENSQLTMQRDEARSALDSSEAERRRLEEQNANLESRLSDKPTEVAAAPASSTPKMDLPEGVSVDNRNGEVVVTIEGDVLFDSGKATLKTDAKKTLDKVVSEIKKNYPNNRVRVSGFTDTDPIKRSGFKTNFHLGFERAFNVGEYVVSKGLDKGRVYYASYGPEAPKATKKESRRVELSIVTE